jgi:hypothetical protein
VAEAAQDGQRQEREDSSTAACCLVGVGQAQQLVGLSVRSSPAAMRRASLIVR